MADNKEREELLQRAMSACSGREYCVNDIVSLLDRWGSKEGETTELIINRLRSEKFIDEHRYCRAFAVDHFRHSHWGRIKISMMLKSKKVDPEAIASGLGSIDDEEYLASLRKIVEDQKKKIKAKNRLDLKGKLLRHALGKGFESHLVYDAINRATGERGSEE